MWGRTVQQQDSLFNNGHVEPVVTVRAAAATIVIVVVKAFLWKFQQCLFGAYQLLIASR